MSTAPLDGLTTKLQIPADLTVVDGNGRITPAWLNLFAGIKAMSVELNDSSVEVPDLPAYATQADMEAATSSTSLVAPSAVVAHPGAAKFWAQITDNAGSPVITTCYNVASVTSPATGRITLTLTTPFATADWCCLVSVMVENNTPAFGNQLTPHIRLSGMAADTIGLQCWDTTAAAPTADSPEVWYVVGYGDQ